MSRFTRRLHSVAGAVLGFGLVFSADSSLAQTGTLDTFSPAPTPEDDFHLARPNDLGHLRVGAHLYLDYALNPLVWETSLGDASTEELSIVQHQLVGTVGVSLGLFDRLVVYAGLPTVLVMNGSSSGSVAPLGVLSADGFGLGDLNLGARIRLYGENTDSFSLALQTTFTFPTTLDGGYSGDRTVGFRPMLLGEIRTENDVRITLNLGAAIRGETLQTTSNIGFASDLRFGAGVGIPVWHGDDPRSHLDVLAQVYGASQYRDFFGRETTNLEATAGARFTHASGVTVGAVAGPGMTRGIGTPDVRAALTVGYARPPVVETPEPVVDPCADTPEDMDGFQDEDGCLDPDNDQDTILDVDDQCVNVPETVNDYQDTDGCPDEIPDTDGDGLRDPQDRCPTEPEDVDTWQDDDGCPDPDNDGDGVVDTSDRCPLVPGVVENHGCPDTDRDSDTVVDRIDNCPDDPGTVPNFGCAVRQDVRIVGDQIEILDTVYFRTDSDVILRRRFGLLNEVARVRTAHPEIGRISVEGHTDNRGPREHNLDLSRRRAASVVRYLVEIEHLEASRFESAGYGPDRPIVPNARTRAEHAQNRRVVFRIVDPTDAVQTTTTGPSTEHIDR